MDDALACLAAVAAIAEERRPLGEKVKVFAVGASTLQVVGWLLRTRADSSNRASLRGTSHVLDCAHCLIRRGSLFPRYSCVHSAAVRRCGAVHPVVKRGKEMRTPHRFIWTPM